jgi:hypothetical protein
LFDVLQAKTVSFSAPLDTPTSDLILAVIEMAQESYDMLARSDGSGGDDDDDDDDDDDEVKVFKKDMKKKQMYFINGHFYPHMPWNGTKMPRYSADKYNKSYSCIEKVCNMRHNFTHIHPLTH